MADGIPIDPSDNIPPGFTTLVNGKLCMKMVPGWDKEGRQFNRCIALWADGTCFIHAFKPKVCRECSCTKAGGQVQARYRFAIGKVPE
jgi:Fe-S-cluster containining protein